MLTFTSGNMFETPADIRINTVNCVGVMGAGLALAFKTKYPEMFRDYQKACKAGAVRPGKLHVWKTLTGDWIINFPTKRHWREPSRYEDIESGLIALKDYLVDKGKVKVLLPAVGCGHGGLEWNRISEMIKKQLADVESEIIVFTPEDSRAAGDKIKDHEDAQIQDRLDAENIKIIEPGHDLYPESLRGRTAAKLYIKGDPKKLNSPLLTILPSPKPTQQEIDAAATTVETIMRPGITLLVGYGASIERPAIKKALEKGDDVVVILSEGILDFRVRKDLLDVWDDNRIVIISATKPLERWSPSTAFRAKDLQLSLASAAIITDTTPQSITKMLIQKASQKHQLIYYVDYGKTNANLINTFKTIKAQSISVNDLSDPKQYEAIINILGANELTQPISERNTETVSAPIAENHVTNEYETHSIRGPKVQAVGGAAYPKRLIEVDLPIKRISEHARREKSIRHGHISTLHIWWARRPLAACRAVICAALWPDPADPLCTDEFKRNARQLMHKWAEEYLQLLTSKESINRFIQIRKNPDKLSDDLFLRQTLFDFIADFANWDNSVVPEYIETSRALTQYAHQSLGGAAGTRPLVVDPFAGGGSIPLETLRIGADAFASDINEVPFFINKTMLEFMAGSSPKLQEEYLHWSKVLNDRVRDKLQPYFPAGPQKGDPFSYFWARTITCEGPSCGRLIPLVGNPHLSKKKGCNHSIAITYTKDDKVPHVLLCDMHDKRVKKMVKGGAALCECGYTTPVESVRTQLSKSNGGTDESMLLAIGVLNEKGQKEYRLPIKEDLDAIQNAQQEKARLVDKSKSENSLFPQDKLWGKSKMNIGLYGMETWDQVFSSRQILQLKTYQEELFKLLNEEKEIPKTVVYLLIITIDKLVDYGTALCRWVPGGEFIAATLGGEKKLPMMWDYAESVLFGKGPGSWHSMTDWVSRVIKHFADSKLFKGTAVQADARVASLPSDSAQAVITDPPYYDAIWYSDLGDLFSVWLKRALKFINFPIEFDTHNLKEKEIIKSTFSEKDGLTPKDDNYYEQGMKDAFIAMRDVLQPSGIAVIVFAHKTTSGWESILTALLHAGWIVTNSWPIDTEREARMTSIGQASLASSIHLVCRPRENPDGSVRMDDIGDWRDVLAELPQRIHEWMPRLAEEGVVGADAIFACLGPALEIFSRYSRVEKASGEQVTLKEYLEQVWAVVAKEALNMIFEGADTAGFEEDARLTAMWLWTLSASAANGDDSASKSEEEDEDEEKSPKVKLSGYMLEYDAARKIAQGLGAHLEQLQSLVEVKGDKARLLSVSERTKSLFGKDESAAPADRRKKKSAQLELGFIEEIEKAEQEGSWGQKNVPQLGNTRLDRLHQSMILFAAGRGEALKRFLVEEGVGQDQKFWRLAQALSALYPSISDEKRWVDGVLARKKGFGF